MSEKALRSFMSKMQSIRDYIAIKQPRRFFFQGEWHKDNANFHRHNLGADLSYVN